MLNVKIKCHYAEKWETIKIRLVFKDSNFNLSFDTVAHHLKVMVHNSHSEFRDFLDGIGSDIILSAKNRIYSKSNYPTNKPYNAFPKKYYSEVNMDKFMEELSEDLSSALEDSYSRGELTNTIWSLCSTETMKYVDWDYVSMTFPFSKESISNLVDYINFEKLLINNNVSQEIRDYCRMFI